MGFSLKQRTQEKDKLWAIAFSLETFVDQPAVETTDPHEFGEQGDPVSYHHCFATCGGPRVTIYDYKSGKGGYQKADRLFRPRQSYTSSHDDEDFFALTFAQSRLVVNNGDEKPEEIKLSKEVLCVGGACASILILDIETCSLMATLKGSISNILDLKAVTCGSGSQKYNLLCSATRDQVRVWNLDTLANVCIFAGDPNGHLGDVLAVAWHPTGSRIVSGGGEAPNEQDSKTKVSNRKKFQICVWKVLDSPRVEEAVQASSYLPAFVQDRSQFNPHLERFAASVHDDVHSNKVDCVAWVGDLVLSKSIFDEIILWQPVIHDKPSSSKSTILPIKIFYYDRNDSFYFIRFSLSSSALLAIGNNVGRVYLWDLTNFDKSGPTQILKTKPSSMEKKLKPNRPNEIIRGVAFSPDGNTLVGCDANGGVFRWDKS